MWIGTQEGLNLFDGNRFKIFSKQSHLKHRLGGSLVADIVEDKKRSLLWVLMSYGDICAIDLNTRTIAKRLTLDHDGQALSEKWMRCLQLQGDTLWIGGHNAISAYSIKDGHYLNLDLEHRSGIGEGEYNISKMIFDSNGRLWLCSEGYGLIVLDRNFRLLTSFKDLDSGQKQKRKLLFWDVLMQGDRLYAATSWGLRMFRANDEAINYLPEKTNDILDRSEIQSIAFASPDILLFSTPNRFYAYNLATRQMQAYQDGNKEDDWLAYTFQIFYDTLSQKIWVGTQAGLASFSFRESPFNSFSKSSQSNTKLKHLYAILPVSDDEIYCGDENGLFYVNTRTKEILSIDTASANLMLFRDGGTDIFVSNKNGFHRIRNRKIKPVHDVFPALKDLEKDHLICGIHYNDSITLFASVIQKGLSVWNKSSGELKTFHNDSINSKIEGLSIINYLYKGNGSEVFILTEKSIIGFNPVTEQYSIKKITGDLPQEAANNFMDMCETEDSYWIATYGNGLLETDKDFKLKKIFTADSGLSNDCIYRVFAYQNRSIIATTNKGLSVIDCGRYSIQNYFQPDGLHGNGFEQLCGYQSGDRIYAGGVNGFTIIEPSHFTLNHTAPSLYLQDLKIDAASGITDTCNLNMELLVIPNDVHQTTIHFSALSYRNPSRIAYAYKIDELGNDWINLGNQNFVNLIGLNHGTYNFQVRASNEDGVWNTKPVKLSLVYLPKWFQTEWFKILVIVTGAVLIYSFFRYRIIQINKQQLIRKEIANDLHDDIGSTLNTLKIFAHLAKKDRENQEHLDQIEESITSATLGLRDMIWVLDDTQDSVFELMERIKKFALPVCIANNILFTSTVHSDINRPISKTEKRNLLLIAKETINNSIKYAACKKIQVTLTRDKNETRLRIEDDGTGFDFNKIVSGKGLPSIQYRARQIAYSLNIDSEPLKGTIIELKK